MCRSRRLGFSWVLIVGYSAKAVGNYFLAKYGNSGISPLKLQKLVYVAHGWHLALRNEPLVDDEYPEAWPFGPVFPSLYHAHKHRGRMPIMHLANDVDLNLQASTPEIPQSDTETIKFLDRIWEVYGGYTALQLSSLCHQSGSPWEQVKEDSPKIRNAPIKNEVIQAYYRKKQEQNRNYHG